jgi:hypothetical protein
MLKIMLIFLFTDICRFINVYPNTINKVLTKCKFYDNFHLTKT